MAAVSLLSDVRPASGRPVRLVCIDVDGTLIGSSGVVHDATWTALERAQARGIRIAISSGRPGFGVTREYAERLDPAGWHIFQNGASVVQLASGRTESAALPDEAVAALIRRARATGLPLELYRDHDYVIESTARRAREHAVLLGVPYEPRAYESVPGPFVRAQWLLSPAEAEMILTEPYPGLEVAPSTSPLMPDTQFVGLTRGGVNKGQAVADVAAQYDVPLDEVMFVGDGGNDESALRRVGHPIAMGNAEPELMAVARHVVGHVDRGGLVEALEIAIAAAA